MGLVLVGCGMNECLGGVFVSKNDSSTALK